MLLIHGLGSSRTIWDRTRPRLERHYDVIAVDLPGFGGQPWFDAPVPAAMQSLATALEEELDRLGIERPYVVGNSMGGWLSLELARRGRARDVIAISPVGGSNEWEAFRSRMTLKVSRLASRAFVPIADGVAGNRMARRIGFSGVATHPDDIAPADAAQAIHHMAEATGFRKIVNDVGGGDRLFERNRERFSQIECRVLIVFGDRDRVISPNGGPRLAEVIPNAELLVLHDVGHTPMLDQPDMVAELVLDRFGRGEAPENAGSRRPPT
jgi:pimeloyl-ACP methyl ester carboxylesterase